MIKETIIAYVQKAIKEILLSDYNIEIQNFIVEKNKDIINGDFYSNVAMATAKRIGRIPLDLATKLSNKIMEKTENKFKKIEAVKPGYINFYLSDQYKKELLHYVYNQKEDYGQFDQKDIFYNIEFVSANPTGYLHIGHARNAALGMTLANIWKKYGITVQKEYYINDAGNQINILGISTFLRYLELFGREVSFDGDYYLGKEIIDIAQEIKDFHNDDFLEIKYSDNAILDDSVYTFFKNFALNKMLSFIKEDLEHLGIEFDIYSSEKELYKDDAIPQTLKKLEKYTYINENATWLKTTEFNDDKDRVLIKSNGDFTYFLPDIAYHYQKITRNPNTNTIFNIWGADHKSYVDRMSIALQCLGFKKDIMHVIIMQMVRLTKNGEEYKMSKRSGNSLTIKDLLNAIGKDSSRWALVSQTSATQIEIDVDKFSSQTHDNNLYYVLYAYARICQIINKSRINIDKEVNSDLLTTLKEQELINLIAYYPCTIETISNSYEVNKIVNYLHLLSQVFHAYYNETKILDKSDQVLLKQRILLLHSLKNTLASGLGLLNITPEEKI